MSQKFDQAERIREFIADARMPISNAGIYLS
jgi:UDP-N-acetylglucosamine transferase subunit ALG13